MINNKTTDLKSFHYLENGEINFSNLDTIKTTKVLDSAIYLLDYIDYPRYVVTVKKVVESESLKIHSFPSKDRIENLLGSFFDEKTIKRISELGFNHKMGILLYGKEGTGKSTIMKYYYNRLIEDQKAIVFHINNAKWLNKIWDFIIQIRDIQENPIIVIFDEFDDYIKDSSDEAYLKKILDGNLSISNCVIMASTNYLEKIPVAIKERPSRFKYVIDIEGIQEEEEVYSLLKNLLKESYTETELKEFVKELKGQTLDIIKQFCFDKIMSLSSYNIKKKTIGFRR